MQSNTHLRTFACFCLLLFAACRHRVASRDGQTITTARTAPAPVDASREAAISRPALDAASAQNNDGALFADLDGDGVSELLLYGDVIFGGSDSANRHSIYTCCGGVGPEWFQVLHGGPRTFAAVRASGHDSDRNEDGTFWSQRWMDFALVAATRSGEVYNAYDTRLELTDTPFAGEESRFAVRSGGAVVFESNGYELPLRWDGRMFHEETCWRRVGAARPAALPAGCVGRPRASFHLRQVESQSRSFSRALPAGTAVHLIEASSIRRGAARLYCVRAPGPYRDEETVGWVFLLADELTGCSLP